MKLAIVGPGRSGKDEIANWLHANTSLCYLGYSTSRVICPHAARQLGISEDEAFARRHEDRALWRRIGDELRAHDPAHLAREVLKHQDVCVGIRARCEIEAAQRERLVDLTLWVARDVPNDETLEYGSEVADLIIENRQSLSHLHARLSRLARALGLHHTPAVEIDRASREPRWESLRSLA